MSELAVAALRLGLLLVLWILIISIVSSQGRDLMVGRKNKVRAQAAPRAATSGTASAAPAVTSEQGAPAVTASAPAPPPGGAQTATRPLPRHLEVTEGPLAGRTIDLNGTPLMLGRAQEVDLVLEDDYVSGRHARLFPQGSRWFLEDLGSTNGTYVGGSQLSRTVPVDPGTPIRIGKTVLVLRP